MLRTPVLSMAPWLLLVGQATADPSVLTGGVLIAHHVPELPYTWDPPSEGWCDAYTPLAIHSLDEVIDSIAVQTALPAVWYVIAAWEQEDKAWRQVDLGFGGFDPAAFGFASAGPCFPAVGIETPSPGWPGPNEGTAFATVGEPWCGNWLALYAFAGYAYGYGSLTTRIELDPNPATGQIGFLNTEPQPRFFPVGPSQRGALGINAAGIVPSFPPPPIEAACCLYLGECELLLEEDCLAQGGEWLEEVLACDPHPCPVWGTCCIGGTGECMTLEACQLVGGTFYPGVW
jgi:hypothetical protein